jgi:DNA-binding CsgD family transcriptional regulator
MDITACVSDCLQKPEDFRHIPALLASTLGIQPISLAVVQTVADGSSILLSAYSESEPPATLEQDLLDIHQHTRPLTPRDGFTLRPAVEPSEMDLQHPAAFPHLTVFTHIIDERHRMLLTIHTQAGAPQLSPDLTEILQLLTRQLGKCLEGLVIWMARPRALGEPFNCLTDHEWKVFRSLYFDGSEKQLADILGISPHTLHSHIKSIYRKIGVQGRLSLLRRADDALRAIRLNRFNARPAPGNTHGNSFAVAIG